MGSVWPPDVVAFCLFDAHTHEPHGVVRVAEVNVIQKRQFFCVGRACDGHFVLPHRPCLHTVSDINLAARPFPTSDSFRRSVWPPDVVAFSLSDAHTHEPHGVVRATPIPRNASAEGRWWRIGHA